jgi:hypothetical protein
MADEAYRRTVMKEPVPASREKGGGVPEQLRRTLGFMFSFGSEKMS